MTLKPTLPNPLSLSLSILRNGDDLSLTPEEKRRRRLQELAAKLKKNGSTDPTLILGWMGMKWGCRIERGREYLEVIELAGLILISKEEIKWIG